MTKKYRLDFKSLMEDIDLSDEKISKILKYASALVSSAFIKCFPYVSFKGKQNSIDACL